MVIFGITFVILSFYFCNTLTRLPSSWNRKRLDSSTRTASL